MTRAAAALGLTRNEQAQGQAEKGFEEAAKEGPRESDEGGEQECPRHRLSLSSGGWNRPWTLVGSEEGVLLVSLRSSLTRLTVDVKKPPTFVSTVTTTWPSSSFFKCTFSNASSFSNAHGCSRDDARKLNAHETMLVRDMRSASRPAASVIREQLTTTSKPL